MPQCLPRAGRKHPAEEISQNPSFFNNITEDTGDIPTRLYSLILAIVTATLIRLDAFISVTRMAIGDGRIKT